MRKKKKEEETKKKETKKEKIKKEEETKKEMILYKIKAESFWEGEKIAFNTEIQKYTLDVTVSASTFAPSFSANGARPD